eukprot:tig00000900_g5372.t1
MARRRGSDPSASAPADAAGGVEAAGTSGSPDNGGRLPGGADAGKIDKMLRQSRARMERRGGARARAISEALESFGARSAARDLATPRPETPRRGRPRKYSKQPSAAGKAAAARSGAQGPARRDRGRPQAPPGDDDQGPSSGEEEGAAAAAARTAAKQQQRPTSPPADGREEWRPSSPPLPYAMERLEFDPRYRPLTPVPGGGGGGDGSDAIGPLEMFRKLKSPAPPGAEGPGGGPGGGPPQPSLVPVPLEEFNPFKVLPAQKVLGDLVSYIEQRSWKVQGPPSPGPPTSDDEEEDEERGRARGPGARWGALPSGDPAGSFDAAEVLEDEPPEEAFHRALEERRRGRGGGGGAPPQQPALTSTPGPAPAPTPAPAQESASSSSSAAAAEAEAAAAAAAAAAEAGASLRIGERSVAEIAEDVTRAAAAAAEAAEERAAGGPPKQQQQGEDEGVLVDGAPGGKPKLPRYDEMLGWTLRVSEAATMLRTSEPTVVRYIKEGRLSGFPSWVPSKGTSGGRAQDWRKQWWVWERDVIELAGKARTDLVSLEELTKILGVPGRTEAVKRFVKQSSSFRGIIIKFGEEGSAEVGRGTYYVARSEVEAYQRDLQAFLELNVPAVEAAAMWGVSTLLVQHWLRLGKITGTKREGLPPHRGWYVARAEAERMREQLDRQRSMVSVRQLAEVLCVSPETVRWWLSTGQLDGIKIDKLPVMTRRRPTWADERPRRRAGSSSPPPSPPPSDGDGSDGAEAAPNRKVWVPLEDICGALWDPTSTPLAASKLYRTGEMEARGRARPRSPADNDARRKQSRALFHQMYVVINKKGEIRVTGADSRGRREWLVAEKDALDLARRRRARLPPAQQADEPPLLPRDEALRSMDEGRLVPEAEAASRLGGTRAAVREALRAGRLPGARYFAERQEGVRWLVEAEGLPPPRRRGRPRSAPPPSPPPSPPPEYQ